MKFKKNDVLGVTQDNPYSADLKVGDLVTVLKRNKYGGYTVLSYDGVITWDLGEDCLEKVETLPIGTQLGFSLCPVSE